MNRKKEECQQTNNFIKLLFASVIYAVLFVTCMYHTSSGITMPCWIVATIFYMGYVLKEFHIRLKKDSPLFMAIMFLLGVSTFATGNHYIIMINYIGFFLILMYFLLHNLYEDASWDYGIFFLNVVRAMFGAICCIATPFTDTDNYIKKIDGEEKKKGLPIFLGILIAIPCVWIFSYLLSSADAVFNEIYQRIWKIFYFPKNIIEIVFLLLFGFFSSYCGMRFLMKRTKIMNPKDRKQMNPVVAITFTSFIAGIYLVFCIIQILYLFAGQGKLPVGMSYASYARTGFFELLFISILNLFLVLFIKNYFATHKLLNILLMILSGATFIMIASSAFRMLLYIKAYHLTFLRVLVFVILLMLVFLMGGVLTLIRQPSFKFLRYSVLSVSIIYLAFSFSHVDYFIASYNLGQINQVLEQKDYRYLSSLSTDAAPIIIRYAKDKGETYSVWYRTYCENNHSVIHNITIRNFNLSHFIARKVIREKT